MKIETAELMRVSQSYSLHGIRWGAVFAGMSVGVGLYVLLMLLAACVGLACLSAGAGSGADVQGAALIWNLLSALAAAMLGAGLTARAADLRRHADGVMHGLVVWGAAMLLGLLLALLAAREMSGGMLLLMAQQASQPSGLGPSSREGWNPRGDGARGVMLNTVFKADQLPGARRPAYRDWTQSAVAAELRESPEPRRMDATMYLTLLVSAAVAMSLFGGIAGGVLGTQRPRRPDPLDHANWREEIDLLGR